MTTQYVRSWRILQAVRYWTTLWHLMCIILLAAWIHAISTYGNLCSVTTLGGHQLLFRDTRVLEQHIQGVRWRGRFFLVWVRCRSGSRGRMYSGALSGLAGPCLSRTDFFQNTHSTPETLHLGRRGMSSVRVCMPQPGDGWCCAT